MSETVTRRRRWPWVVLAVLLLLVAGPLAWKYRPLNATERKLVGAWAPVSEPNNRVRFMATHRVGRNSRSRVLLPTGGVEDDIRHFEEFASWTANSNELRLTLDTEFTGSVSLPFRIQFMCYRLLGLTAETTPISFEDENRLVVGRQVYVRVAE